MQPLAAGRPGVLGGHPDQPGAHAPAAHPAGDDGVQDERMHPAVPGPLHEADQLAVLPCADPAEAVPVQLCAPVVVEQPVAEALGVQPVELGVVHAAAPLVVDHLLTVEPVPKPTRGSSGPGAVTGNPDTPNPPPRRQRSGWRRRGCEQVLSGSLVRSRQ
jgi:hypothetical protein